MKHLTDKNFKSLNLKAKVKCMLVTLGSGACGAFAIFEYEKKESTILFIAMIVFGIIFAASCIVGIIIENKKYENYSCKECGTKFKGYELGDKEEFIFICNECSITWHTETFSGRD